MRMDITERALAARIDRKLWRTEQARLRRISPNSRGYREYGPYCVVQNNTLTNWGISDLEKLARDMDCLAAHERLAGGVDL